MMNKFLFITFLSFISITYSQQSTSCKIDQSFTDNFYFYSYNTNDKTSDLEPNKKLVSSIFSLIENKTRLELTNKEGKSSSNFTQTSTIKSKAFLINPSKCVNSNTTIVFVNKKEFNSLFLNIYINDLNLTRNRLNSILNTTSIDRGSKFLEKEVQEFKLEFNELKFYLPFANSISDSSYDNDVQEIYKSLTKLEIYTLSIDEQINILEQSYLELDCKTALTKVNSLLFLKPKKAQTKRITKLRKNIEKNCQIDQKKEFSEAKNKSIIFNNIEIALSLQSFPTNVSSDVPKLNEFNLDSFFASARFNYLLGVSDSGLRFGPYLKYNFLNGAINKEQSNIVFSDNFSEAGITARYRLIRNFLEIEFSFGRSINKIIPLADNNIDPFNFITVSPNILFGSTNKGISFSVGLDYISANNNSNYKYISGRVGINYNIQFKKLNKLEKEKIKNNYEIKS